ncbi:universal stress protein [Variovorax sp. PAMC 28711]|uniref:universal stress protein n=1 Tax=Variovorax sp. PAMC 28711 TaxID=1795631 RepID=UPI00078E520F|nr:universal stress protein [Variovorax sp. PAMC 28711]AMM26126.1 universal stress protein UspA [Variovorax sp. PAMC 28711]
MKILVAVDGSAFTRKALDYLVTHRHMFVEGNHLVVVHVCMGIPNHVAKHVSKDVVDSYYTEESAKVIDPLRAFFAEKNITDYSLEVRHGHAAEEILRTCRATGAELIVLGTHGHGIFGRALMGSVATKVIGEADISVLLVQ